jgi:hypothetical protein
MDVVDAAADDPAQVAEGVRARFEATNFDYENEYPVRLAVIVRDGVPTHDVATLCHLVTDGLGALLLLDEIAARDPVTGQAAGPVGAIDPLELARAQNRPVMRRQSDAAVRYWEGIMREIPLQRFGDSPEPRSPRCWNATLNSPATHQAVGLIASRHNLDFAQVLMAVVAIALARTTRNSPAVLQVLVHNRFRPGLADVVGQVAMWGLCEVDVADTTLEDAFARCWRSAIRMYKHSYYDPRQLAEMMARVGRERGAEVDLSCFYNDRRMLGQQDATGPAPSAESIRAALSRSALRWGQASDWGTENKLLIHVNPVPDTVEIEAHADTHFVSVAQVEALLRAVEQVAVQAALDLRAPTGVTAAPLPAALS